MTSPIPTPERLALPSATVPPNRLFLGIAEPDDPEHFGPTVVVILAVPGGARGSRAEILLSQQCPKMTVGGVRTREWQAEIPLTGVGDLAGGRARKALEHVAAKLGVSTSEPHPTIDQIEDMALRRLGDLNREWGALSETRELAYVALRNLGFEGGDLDAWVERTRLSLVVAERATLFEQPAPAVPTDHLVDEPAVGPAPEHVIAGLHRDLEAARRLYVQIRAGREEEQRACLALLEGLTPPEAPPTLDLHGLLSVWVPELRRLLANEASTLKLRDDLRAALAVDPAADHGALVQRAQNLVAIREAVVEHLGGAAAGAARAGTTAPAAMPRAAAALIKAQNERIAALEADAATLRDELARERGGDTSATRLGALRMGLATKLGLSEIPNDGALLAKVEAAVASDAILRDVRAALALQPGENVVDAAKALRSEVSDLRTRDEELDALCIDLGLADGSPLAEIRDVVKARENLRRNQGRTINQIVEFLERFAQPGEPLSLACVRGALAHIDRQAERIAELENILAGRDEEHVAVRNALTEDLRIIGQAFGVDAVDSAAVRESVIAERGRMRSEIAELCKLREAYLAGADRLHAVADVVRDEANRRGMEVADDNVAKAAADMFDHDRLVSDLYTEASRASGRAGMSFVEWCRESAAIRRGVKRGEVELPAEPGGWFAVKLAYTGAFDKIVRVEFDSGATVRYCRIEPTVDDGVVLHPVADSPE